MRADVKVRDVPRLIVPVIIVVMVMTMARGGGAIRTCLRVERRFDRIDVPAQALHHFRDHVIGSDL